MIHVQRRDRVVRLALSSPPVNVLDAVLLAELTAELRRLAADDTVAAVLVEGSGRCFSAGASVAEHTEELAPSMLAGLIDACCALAELPVPAVALVHGVCLGGAMELIAFCDFVVADPGASFGQPEIKLAFFPPVACSQLPRHAGLQNAAYAILTGETLTAEQAATMGMVQRIMARDEWGELEKLFNDLSAAALRETKGALMEGAGDPRRDALEGLKRRFLDRLYRLEDVAEGIASFTERRRPQWRHR